MVLVVPYDYRQKIDNVTQLQIIDDKKQITEKKSAISAHNVDYNVGVDYRLKRSGSKDSCTLCDSSFIYSIMELDVSRKQATYTPPALYRASTGVTLSLLNFGQIKEDKFY